MNEKNYIKELTLVKKGLETVKSDFKVGGTLNQPTKLLVVNILADLGRIACDIKNTPDLFPILHTTIRRADRVACKLCSDNILTEKLCKDFNTIITYIGSYIKIYFQLLYDDGGKDTSVMFSPLTENYTEASNELDAYLKSCLG